MSAPERPTEDDLQQVAERELALLHPDFLVTYRSGEPGREALRSSIWLRNPDAGRLLLFHQGTPSVVA